MPAWEKSSGSMVFLQKTDFMLLLYRVMPGIATVCSADRTVYTEYTEMDQ